MILSNAKDQHRYRYHHRHPGHGLATPLAFIVASLAILAAAVVVVPASAAEEATPFKVEEGTPFKVVPADEAFQVNAPTTTTTNDAPTNDAGIVEPYPDDFDIGIGQGESLLFAGTWAAPSKMWTNFFVESDVPVILNRITAGPYSRLSWGAPGGVVSVIVKTNCNTNNNNNNNDTVLESEMMELEIDPIVSTEMVTVFGQTIPKISIMALAEDDDTTILPPPPPPSNPSIPLAESRMADQENGDSPNFLPSSDFTHDYECWTGWRTCAPKQKPNQGSSLAAQAAAASPETPIDANANAAAAAAGTDPLAGSSSSSSSTIDSTDAPTDRPAPTDGPAGSTTTNGASASTSSAAGSANKITVNLLLGVVTTASMLIVGTVGVVFDKHQRTTLIRAATAIAMFGVMFVAILPPPAHSLSSFQESGGSRRSLNNDAAEQPQCAINVEIVYWGCDHQVFIDAPGVSLRNGVETSESDWETCECQEQQRFVNTTTKTTTTDRRAGDEKTTTTDRGDEKKNPDAIAELEIIDAREHSMLYHVAGYDLDSSCFMAIGRPYRDNTGNIVSAGICDVTKDETSGTDQHEHEHEHEHSGSEMEQSWSEPSLSFLSSTVVAANVGGVNDDRRNHHRRRLGGNDNTQQRKERQRLGKEWTDRALGEHASVASFAAFTLALLSNQAPPELIRDSLTAAQDELRHAKVSFEIASMLSSNSIIEPTALPPSTLQFDANRTALALGTAREGCVEETLSAIEMAVEYDEFVVATAGDGDGDGDGSDDFVATTLTPIMETTKIIALEEGNHSVLAWRTIEWICSSNSSSSSSSSSNNNNSNEACKAVHQHVLDPSKLAQAGQKRFPSSPRARQIWDCIWTSLLPAIAVSGNTMNDDDTVAVNGTTTTKENILHGYEKCSFLDDSRVVGEDTNAATLSELLAHKIVSQVRSEDAIIVGAKKGIAETK